MLTNFKEHLQSEVSIKDPGPTKRCLGMNVTYDAEAGTLQLDQTDYIESILQKFNMANCNPADSPLERGQVTKYYDDDDDVSDQGEQDEMMYRAAIGSFIWLIQGARPNLSYSTSLMGSFGQAFTL